MRAPMSKGKELLLPVLAMTVLLIGTAAAVYVHETQINKDTITINGEEYSIDDIFLIAEKRVIETDEGEKSGVALDDLLIKTGYSCLSCHSYVIKGADGYQQTIPWDMAQNGVLTKERIVFFSDSAHSFWIRDIVEIEVK